MVENDEPGRRYSDEELALILRKASERQEADPASGAPGLTLGDVQEIAGEVGLDPEAVARAAATLPAGSPDGLATVLGGPFSYRLDHVLPGEISEADFHRIILAVRRATGHQGESSSDSRSMAWSGVHGSDSIEVSVTPRGGETAIEVVCSRGFAAMATYLTSGFLSVVAMLLTMMLYDPSPNREPLALAVLAAWLGIGFLASRTLLKRSSAELHRKLGSIFDEVSLVVEGALHRGRSSTPVLEPADEPDDASEGED